MVAESGQHFACCPNIRNGVVIAAPAVWVSPLLLLSLYVFALAFLFVLLICYSVKICNRKCAIKLIVSVSLVPVHDYENVFSTLDLL